MNKYQEAFEHVFSLDGGMLSDYELIKELVEKVEVIERAYESFEKIVAFEFETKGIDVFLEKYTGSTKTTIGDILDGNLSDEMISIYEALGCAK